MTTTPAITEQTTALAIVENMTPALLFAPGTPRLVLDQIKAKARTMAADLDISTPDGKKAIASLVRKIASSKTFIDSKRKELVADEKKRLSLIDADGKIMWDELEALQVEIRKPLTDWEEAEEKRTIALDVRCRFIEGLGSITYGTVAQVDQSQGELDKAWDHNFQEFTQRAQRAHEKALLHLKAERIRIIDEAMEREATDRIANIARISLIKFVSIGFIDQQREALAHLVNFNFGEKLVRRADEIANQALDHLESETKRLNREEEDRAEAQRAREAKIAEDARLDAEQKAREREEAIAAQARERELQLEREKEAEATKAREADAARVKAETERVKALDDAAATRAEFHERTRKLDEERQAEIKKANDAQAAREEEFAKAKVAQPVRLDPTTTPTIDRRKEVHKVIIRALVAEGLGQKTALAVCRSLSEGKITHVSISY